MDHECRNDDRTLDDAGRIAFGLPVLNTTCSARGWQAGGAWVRVLKRFPTPLRGSYNLDQISPCRRFALVRRSSPIGDGWGQSYFVVNAEDGDTQALLEDKVCGIAGSRISYVHWVKAAVGTP